MIRNALMIVCLGTLTASAWELGPSDPVAWTPPPGRAAESNLLSQSASFLASTLSRVSGHPVAAALREEAPGAGIHLALDPSTNPVTADAVFSGRLEAYRIEATGAVLRISGPTAAGVRNGVMAFLHRQGCRWLLPSPKWWVIPEGKAVTFTGREEGAPGFAYRRIWYAYGAATPEFQKHYQVWAEANRLGGVAAFQTGHSYDNIIARNKADFQAHPEYFAMNETSNGPTRNLIKFCSSNPGLRALCLRDRLALLQSQRKADPLAFMVSMDPSDGPGICECAECRKLGDPPDRVVSLANHVARGLREAEPGAWVGMYAYSTHRNPPAIAVESNIHVQVAMAFNKGPHTYEDLIRLWGKKAGSLGIREYYGVEAWDFGMPGRIRGADPAYHAKWIPRYKAAGAVSVSAESNDNSGPQGLGFYVAARLLWDSTADAGAEATDFLQSAFGPAVKPMQALYAAFISQRKLEPETLSKLYDLAFEALGQAADPAVRARVVDVIAYLNYVDRFIRFERCAGHTEPYYAALESLMNYAHRIRSRGMVASYALARRLCNGNVKGRRDDFWMFNPDVVWKHGADHTDEEILAMAGTVRAALKEEKAGLPAFSRDLVLVRDPPGKRAIAGRDVNFRYTAVAFLLPRETGPYAFRYGPGVSATVEKAADHSPVASYEGGQEATNSPAAVELREGTLYRLVLRTGKTSSAVTFPEKLAVALEASTENPLWLESGASFYVYVPPQTAELACTGDPRLSLLNPEGNRIDVTPEMQAGARFAKVAAPPREAGILWTVHGQTRGEVVFYNVPPLVQLDRAEVLLPREAANLAEPNAADDPGKD